MSKFVDWISDYYPIIYCVLGFLVVFALIVYAIVDKRIREKVKKNSARYIYMKQIPALIAAESVNAQYYYRYSLNSKARFDRLNIESEMINNVLNDVPTRELIKKALYNKGRIATYKQLLVQAPPYKEPQKGLFHHYEEKITKKMELETKPVVPIFVFSYSYTSPKGRNRYSRRYQFTIDEILYYREKGMNMLEYRKDAQYQRSLMTDSLRYNILKRDGFRCVLCGASADDGVRLHVDHIVPVSKGGKTEEPNLRTLCENCNLGKRDKYDPTGLN